ncbi:hypothetical protein O9929_05825 [Vibrio lentus]|nr:hypothetical protein [Vibrio lentus]
MHRASQINDVVTHAQPVVQVAYLGGRTVQQSRHLVAKYPHVIAHKDVTILYRLVSFYNDMSKAFQYEAVRSNGCDRIFIRKSAVDVSFWEFDAIVIFRLREALTIPIGVRGKGVSKLFLYDAL